MVGNCRVLARGLLKKVGRYHAGPVIFTSGILGDPKGHLVQLLFLCQTTESTNIDQHPVSMMGNRPCDGERCPSRRGVCCRSSKCFSTTSTMAIGMIISELLGDMLDRPARSLMVLVNPIMYAFICYYCMLCLICVLSTI